MDESLRLIDDPGSSYSFLFGDAFRQSISKPWLLPVLPFTLVKRFSDHRKFMKKSVSNLVRHLILIDSEVIDEDDLKEFQSVLTELDRDVVVNIGSNKNYISTISLLSRINSGDVVVNIGSNKNYISTISLLSRINSGLSSNEWNSYLEDMLTSLIRTQRPSSFIFIGKYPYAGITGMLRRVGESSRTLWIPVRAKEDSLLSRGDRFGFVSSTDTWSKIVKPPLYSQSMVHLHSNLDDGYREKLHENGVELSQVEEKSGILLMPSNDLTDNWPLLEGKIVITIGESTNFIKNLPEYLRSKNIHLNQSSPEEISNIIQRIINSQLESDKVETSLGWRRKILFQSIVDSSFKEI